MNGPPPSYPPLGTKPIPPLMGNLALPVDQPPPGYRGRYDGPPPFEDIPPGVEPPVPGFEPPPFEKPPFQDRDRLPPPNYRDHYGPSRPNYPDGPSTFRDVPLSATPNEIPVHVGEPPRFRDNYRPGALPYREGPPTQFRDGQPYRDVGPQGPFRDPNYRGPPPSFRDGPYRNVPFRDPGFRDSGPHNAFREGGPPFRPPSVDSREPREPIPPNFHDSNFRDAFRDEAALREHGRPGYRSGIRNRGGPRRNPNGEHDRHREREGHDRERYNEVRETDKAERSREPEKRVREGRTREYDRNREHEKERDHDRTTPDKKSRGGSPKRSKDGRDKRRSESRGRSRDRDSKKEKKDDRNRDRSSAEKVKDHKEKDKKIKDRKKKKREKEKELEKKKKRDKKDKKDKDIIKKEGEDVVEKSGDQTHDKKDSIKNTSEKDTPDLQNINVLDAQSTSIKQEKPITVQSDSKSNTDLYGDEASEAVDKEIVQNYVKSEENDPSTDKDISKEEPFDGIELQADVEELDLKPEPETPSKEMLAPLPELSKWEVDDDNAEKTKEPGEITSPEEEDGGKVTSDVIKRAEHAIFTKAIHGSLRPIEIKKISNDRLKLYSDEGAQGSSMNNIQITVPVTDSNQRSIEINERKKRFSKTPPPRLSVKERLGGKVDVKRGREPRVVHSTVERVKSRSKTPKKELPYRRVTVEKEKTRKQELGGRSDSKLQDKFHGRTPRERKDSDKRHKDDKKNTDNAAPHSQDKTVSNITKNTVDRERKKSTLDEAHFEPDYDETVESDNEMKVEDATKNQKRERSSSPAGNDTKKAKVDNETIKLDLSNVKKKPDTESESSSASDTSSSSSDDARKRKKKKKRSKKKKKRAASDSESDSESSSDDHKKKKKKRKHKKKSSKKKKKSKHK